MACIACGTVLNGIYKHAPMTKAQIDAAKTREREITLMTDTSDSLFSPNPPTTLHSLLTSLHTSFDSITDPLRFIPTFEMTSTVGDDGDRRHIVTWEGLYAMRNALAAALPGTITNVANVGSGTGHVFKSLSGSTIQLKSLLAGSGVTITDNTSDITISSSYSLPAATSSVLGGVIVGSGLSVSSGTISNAGVLGLSSGTGISITGTAANPIITNTYTYLLPKATTSQLGGVMQGTNVTIDTNGYISVANIPVATSTILGGVKQGSNVTISGDGTISVASPTGGTITSGTSLGSGSAIYASVSGANLQFKSLVSGAGIGLVSDANTVTISNTMSVVSANISVSADYNVTLVAFGSASDLAACTVAYNGLHDNAVLTITNPNNIRIISASIYLSTAILTLPTCSFKLVYPELSGATSMALSSIPSMAWYDSLMNVQSPTAIAVSNAAGSMSIMKSSITLGPGPYYFKVVM